jgi:hypothetical protein
MTRKDLGFLLLTGGATFCLLAYGINKLYWTAHLPLLTFSMDAIIVCLVASGMFFVFFLLKVFSMASEKTK